MARILIVYGTTEGQTRKIAERMGAVLEELGHSAEVRDSTTIAEPLMEDIYDGVMVGGSVHEERYQSALRHFVRANLGVLQKLPTAFFSVSLSAASEDVEDRVRADVLIEEFLEETGLRPRLTQAIAGALRYTEYDFLRRWIVKLTVRHSGGPTFTSRDHEFTDWGDVARFATEFADLCAAQPKTQGAGA